MWLEGIAAQGYNTDPSSPYKGEHAISLSSKAIVIIDPYLYLICFSIKFLLLPINNFFLL